MRFPMAGMCWLWPTKPPSVVNNAKLETVLQKAMWFPRATHACAQQLISHPSRLSDDPSTLANHIRHRYHHQYLARWSARSWWYCRSPTCVYSMCLNEPNIDAQLLKACSIVTPHIAGYTLEGKLRGAQFVCYNALKMQLFTFAPTVDFHTWCQLKCRFSSA